MTGRLSKEPIRTKKINVAGAGSEIAMNTKKVITV